MHLRVCSAPAGTLASAPMTAMWTGSDHERLEAFWGEDDIYYVCRQGDDDEGVEWYCFEELDGAAELALLDATASAAESSHASVERWQVDLAASVASSARRLVLGGRATRRQRRPGADAATVDSLLERQELQRARPSDITFAWVARRRRRT